MDAKIWKEKLKLILEFNFTAISKANSLSGSWNCEHQILLAEVKAQNEYKHNRIYLWVASSTFMQNRKYSLTSLASYDPKRTGLFSSLTKWWIFFSTSYIP